MRCEAVFYDFPARPPFIASPYHCPKEAHHVVVKSPNPKEPVAVKVGRSFIPSCADCGLRLVGSPGSVWTHTFMPASEAAVWMVHAS